MKYKIQREKTFKPDDSFLFLLRQLVNLLNDFQDGLEHNTHIYLHQKHLPKRGVLNSERDKSLHQRTIIELLKRLQKCNIVFKNSYLISSIIDRKVCTKENAKEILELINGSSKNIFLIYGQDFILNEEIKTLLVGNGYTVKALDERPVNGSETIFERIEEQAEECMWAVAIFSSDDSIKSEEEDYFQARPNVFFETGFVFSQYGRSQVLIIKTDTSKICTDLEGITFINAENKDLIISSINSMTDI